MSKISERYILIKGKAGLGNRLLVLLGSIVYADLTDRLVLIDWCDGAYAQYGENAFPHLFASPYAGDLSVLSGAKTLAPDIWRNNLNRSVDNFFSEMYPDNCDMDCNRKVASLYTIDLKNICHEESVVVRWGWTDEIYRISRYLNHRSNKYSSMSNKEILSNIIRTQFKPAEDLRLRIDHFRRQNFGNNQVIGVHVRYTDRVNSYLSYYPHVDKFLKINRDGIIFLATDNSEVEAAFRSRYPRVAVIEKWFPSPGIPIHRNRLPDKDALQNAKSAIIELYLLGACNSLLFNSTSTFGLFASLLSDASPANVIDLASWSIKRSLKRIYERLFQYVP